MLLTSNEIFEQVNKEVDYEEILKVKLHDGYINEDDFEEMDFVVYALNHLSTERALQSFERMDTFLRDVFADIILENK